MTRWLGTRSNSSSENLPFAGAAVTFDEIGQGRRQMTDLRVFRL
jgi:hypothetical protein